MKTQETQFLKKNTEQKIEDVFCDIQEPLNLKKAKIEADRCFYCYDAPCIQACPTEIDIPSFIRKIGNGNIKGAAMDILNQNILGGTCSRVCPVETLCQQACVREKSEEKPVQIGLLQRFATDEFFKLKQQPFVRKTSTGKKVAVVGAGPAGLSCAHQLSKQGHQVTIFEAKPKAGGLNEYGLAPYKMTNEFAQKEIEFVLSLGGIEIKNNMRLGKDITLENLKKDFDSVFISVGLGATNSLGISGENSSQVIDAVRFIEKIRQAKSQKEIPVGQHVVVIGGGNTAVDISIQMKKLGAEFVTMVYRRGTESMGATGHEQELAQKNGVLIKTWAKPAKIIGNEKEVSGIEFEYTELSAGEKLVGTGKFFTLPANQIFKAIGQTLVQESLRGEKGSLEVAGGKISVNDQFQTSIPGIFAGGDCVKQGEDLTVSAVQQGKLAAMSIHKLLGGTAGGRRG